ncbi:unnamed protein product [Bursaphelenchus okinawaensis]|uniref:Mos1 transposase HTH domain-containing protein n=1 Tax=Bursaphelenchus okinawaensis TaxID=465554 RepID=A0A811KN46_9BILA|nr:unnamed protein product [Bursaphelenchus okinawaensis]CAG9106575.1 unnamed protein product [Bursaphelenchus okinawaensis]
MDILEQLAAAFKPQEEALENGPHSSSEPLLAEEQHSEQHPETEEHLESDQLQEVAQHSQADPTLEQILFNSLDPVSSSSATALITASTPVTSSTLGTAFTIPTTPKSVNLYGVKRDQLRTIIYYHYLRKVPAAQTAKEICETLGEGITCYKTVKSWYSQFSKGRTVAELEDQPRSGRKRGFENEALVNAVEANPRQTTRELAAQLNVAKSTVIRHLQLLGYVFKDGQFVHKKSPKKEKGQNGKDKEQSDKDDNQNKEEVMPQENSFDYYGLFSSVTS